MPLFRFTIAGISWRQIRITYQKLKDIRIKRRKLSDLAMRDSQISTGQFANSPDGI
jgi:hypothetical protein